jgi:hypothetical protein
MMNRILNYSAGIIVCIAIAILIYFSFLFYWPYKVIEFDSKTLQTSKQQYKRGEAFVYTVKYNKFMAIPATVIRSFEDGIVYQLPTTQTDNPAGRQCFSNNSITIPSYLPPGNYIMRMTLIYKVNSFREIIYKLQTNKFEILRD